MRRGLAVSLALLLLALANPVSAEGTGFNLNNVHHAPGAGSLFVTHGARTLGPWAAGFDLGANFVLEPLVTLQGDERTVLVDRALFLQTAARLGLPTPIPVEAQLLMPVGLALKGVNPATRETLDSGSPGDLTLAAKAKVTGKGDTGVFLYPWLSIPSGGEANLTGEQSAAFGLVAGYEGKMVALPLRWGGNLGYLRRGEVAMGKTDVGDRVNYSLGGQYDLIGGERLTVGAEVYGAVDIANPSSADQLPLEWNLGGAAKFGTCQIALGYGFGIIRGIGAGTSRFLTNLSCTGGGGSGECGKGDRDGDEIDDCWDKCPDEPEDMDGVADWDGCPEDDFDKDGIPDKDDLCPLHPEDKDGMQDDDGCPEAGEDRDGDGIVDKADKCPDEAEDRDDFEDSDGCPDPDNDQDGFADADDRCPNEAEDKDGVKDDDGCPDDNDEDGIPDAEDRCPDEPETYNDVEDHDGCPDGEELVVKKSDKLEIREVVLFKTGSAEISNKSRRLLDSVATIILKHPELTRLRVEGHTDDVGRDDNNMALSKARAASVRKYLVERGVQASRLESEGYGETRPITDVPSMKEQIEKEVDEAIAAERTAALAKKPLEGKKLAAYEAKLKKKKAAALKKALRQTKARIKKARAENRRVEFIIVR